VHLKSAPRSGFSATSETAFSQLKGTFLYYDTLNPRSR